jgi:AbiV family abortive infection protein
MVQQKSSTGSSPSPERKQIPDIPRDDLKRGWVLSLRTADQHADAARQALEGGVSSAGHVLLSFAAEELGKAVLLREAYEGKAARAQIKGFYDHRAKLKAAVKFIDLLPFKQKSMRNLFKYATKDLANRQTLEARLSGLSGSRTDGARRGGYATKTTPARGRSAKVAKPLGATTKLVEPPLTQLSDRLAAAATAGSSGRAPWQS